jgi:hypothetical protein
VGFCPVEGRIPSNFRRLAPQLFSLGCWSANSTLALDTKLFYYRLARVLRKENHAADQSELVLGIA